MFTVLMPGFKVNDSQVLISQQLNLSPADLQTDGIKAKIWTSWPLLKAKPYTKMQQNNLIGQPN